MTTPGVVGSPDQHESAFGRWESSTCSGNEGGGVLEGEGEGRKVTKGRWGGGVTGGEDEVDVVIINR